MGLLQATHTSGQLDRDALPGCSVNGTVTSVPGSREAAVVSSA